MREGFADYGYAEPVRIFGREEAWRALDSCFADSRPSLDWEKGRAATSRPFYDLAVDERITSRVGSLLESDNIILWGASIQSRLPDQVHPWHSDIECVAPGVRTLSVWLGLKEVSKESGLHLISRSHLFDDSIQRIRFDRGIARSELTDAEILRLAREIDPLCALAVPEIRDGEALFFDGRIWHGSRNGGQNIRHALLLQYASAESPIRIPDFNRLDWPFRYLEVPKPASILVSGSSDRRFNRIVKGPPLPSGSMTELTSRTYPLEIPLPKIDADWQAFPIFSGVTSDLEISCHVSALLPGATPHPPHSHEEEEFLVMLSGEAELVLPQTTEGSLRIGAGEFVYYPSGWLHTLRAVGTEPANYMMFKWVCPGADRSEELGFRHVRLHDHFEKSEEGFFARTIFEGSTKNLGKLQAHASTLTTGAGYEPHADAYDVALIVLEGELETLGEKVGPNGVVFYRAGEMHGVRGLSAGGTRYLVFEWHGRASAVPPPIFKPSTRWLLKRLVKKALPERLVRKASSVRGRLRT